MQKIKIAINGFGRIGRAAFKIALENPKVEVVAINDLTPTEVLANLLQRDTVYGIYEKKVDFTKSAVMIDNKRYPVSSIAEPNELPWKKYKVDIVLECTGIFTDKGADGHLKAGAKQVIISAPTKAKTIDTFIMGGNSEKYQPLKKNSIISMASCTTNCSVPVVNILDSNFGVKKALLTTIHAYTSTQSIVDGPNKKPERGRAAAQNIVPTTTGAAISTTKVLKQLDKKFDGLAIRVPVVCGSISDITLLLNKDVTVDQINNSFIKATKHPPYKGIVEVVDEPLVSTDIIGSSASAIIQTNLTRVVGGNLVKIMAWYDNEWGYSTRLIEQSVAIGKQL